MIVEQCTTVVLILFLLFTIGVWKSTGNLGDPLIGRDLLSSTGNIALDSHLLVSFHMDVLRTSAMMMLLSKEAGRTLGSSDGLRGRGLGWNKGNDQTLRS